jgi:hypothetical protein
MASRGSRLIATARSRRHRGATSRSSTSIYATDRPGLIDSLGQGGIGQPPLAGATMWLTAAFVPDSDPEATRHFFDLSAALLTMVLAVAVTAVALTAGRRSWDAAHLAVSPVLITAGLISYELLALAFLAAALLALARGRPLIGGLLLGLTQALAIVLLGAGFKNVAALSVLIFVLLLFPNGIFTGLKDLVRSRAS